MVINNYSAVVVTKQDNELCELYNHPVQYEYEPIIIDTLNTPHTDWCKVTLFLQRKCFLGKYRIMIYIQLLSTASFIHPAQQHSTLKTITYFSMLNRFSFTILFKLSHMQAMQHKLIHL